MDNLTDYEIGFIIGCMISIIELGEGNNVEIAKSIKNKLKDYIKNRKQHNGVNL